MPLVLRTAPASMSPMRAFQAVLEAMTEDSASVASVSDSGPSLRSRSATAPMRVVSG